MGKMRNYFIRTTAVTVAMAVGCGLWGDAAPLGAYKTINAAAVSVKEDKKEAGADSEYWRFQAQDKINLPLALSGGGLFITTEKGIIHIVDGDGKELFRKNAYAELTAPASGKNGEIWFSGRSARLHRYDAKGNGAQAAIFYFSKKTDGLVPSPVVTDGQGIPYFSYEHGVLSLNKDDAKEVVLLPAGAKVQQLVPAEKGVIALGSDGVLYGIAGGKQLWQAKPGIAASGAVIAADGSGGVVVAAGKKLAAYDAKGEQSFLRELPALPAGGWASLLAVAGGDAGIVIAAQRSSNELVAFRPSDGTELWRRGADGAGGFAGPAALASDGASGIVLAASRSGALYGIAAEDGAIAYSYKPAAGSAAAGAVSLGGGKVAFASARLLVAAGPSQPVAIAYPAGKLKLALGARVLLPDKLKLSEDVQVRYRSDNGKIVAVNADGIVTPAAAGKANITVEVAATGYRGQYVLPVEVTAAASLKATHASQKVKVGNKTFTVQTVTMPKNMPVTLGTGARKVGTTAGLADIAKSYGAVAAINGTYYSAYGGAPDPYGMMIADGKLQHIGNTGTTIGFAWDGSVQMDRLRVTVKGGTNGSFSHPNNWYAYFMNRVPTEGSSAATLFTPKRGDKIGFSFGRYVTVRNGIVTKIGRNENAAIPADGYVIVFSGGEEPLADRFKVGTTVDYTVETRNLEGELVDWSKVHTAVGAGPRLVLEGKAALKAAEEGFTEAKILTSPAGRSGIFVKKDGTVVLATVSGATMQQWAEIMVKLGAWQGMNLDGGASSGLYANGKAVTQPGRLISNALLFGPQLKW